MCRVTKDIEEIEKRLACYKSKHISLQNIKTNAAEFERRKLVYFCDLNKEALEEICIFIAEGIPEFLRDSNYDLLNRECERDGLSDLFFVEDINMRGIGITTLLIIHMEYRSN